MEQGHLPNDFHLFISNCKIKLSMFATELKLYSHLWWRPLIFHLQPRKPGQNESYLWWRPLISHLQPHKPGQNESVIFPLFAVRLICLFFFYLLIVNLMFCLIISFTSFHNSCTLALPFMITLHNNLNISNSASFQRYFSCIMLTQDVGVSTGFLYWLVGSPHQSVFSSVVHKCIQVHVPRPINVHVYMYMYQYLSVSMYTGTCTNTPMSMYTGTCTNTYQCHC